MLATVTVGNLLDNMNGDISSIDNLINSDGGDGISLREAIAAANNLAGVDEIDFATTGKIDIASQLPTITDGLTINGPGANQLTIDAGNGTDNTFATGDGYRIFNVTNFRSSMRIDVTFSGLTLTGGDAANGSNGHNGSPGEAGGAILSEENLTLIDSVVTGNAAGAGGIGYGYVGPYGVYEGFGGSGGAGGGIQSNGGSLTVTGSTVSGNVAGAAGDGLVVGTNGSGGGIAFLSTEESEKLSVTDSTISGNRTKDAFGAVGGYGGGIALDTVPGPIGNHSIDASTISDNSTAGENAFGGGINIFGGTLLINGSTIRGNSTAGFGSEGGGINFGGASLDIFNSTVSGNSTAGVNANGGGISSNGTSQVTFLINSTVSSNSIGNGQGGGIFQAGGDTLILSSTVTDNTAPAGNGSGIASWNTVGASTEIGGSIVAGNTNEDLNLSSFFFDRGFNLIGVDPLLGDLTNNGGPTLTHIPLIGSPSIDAGDPNFTAPPNFDQRGNPFVRVFDGGIGVPRIDIGAIEFQSTSVEPSADFDGDGDTDGADFLIWQRGFGTPKPNGNKANGDADNDMDVDSADLVVWESLYGPNTFLDANNSVANNQQPVQYFQHKTNLMYSPVETSFASGLVDLATVNIWTPENNPGTRMMNVVPAFFVLTTFDSATAIADLAFSAANTYEFRLPISLQTAPDEALIELEWLDDDLSELFAKEFFKLSDLASPLPEIMQ